MSSLGQADIDSGHEEQGPDPVDNTTETQRSRMQISGNNHTLQSTDGNNNGELIRKIGGKHHSTRGRKTGINIEKENYLLQKNEMVSQYFPLEETGDSETYTRSEEEQTSLSHYETNDKRMNCMQIEAEKEGEDTERNALFRRSEEASLLLGHGNPNITDLSDKNRPTKLAEKFSELYSNEHTDAFEELQALNIDEKTSVSILLNVIKEAYRFCSIKAQTERKLLLEELQADSHMKDFYNKTFLNIIKDRFKGTTKKLDIFAKECVSIIWLMCVQDPPIFMEWVDNDDDIQFDSEKYRFYTKSGTKIDFCVWPVVYLSKKGLILLKGIAQGK